MEQKLTHPFLPIIAKESQILILGSFPSIISRKNNFYYGNPQNRFWKILSALFKIDFVNLNNQAKKEKLLEKHIALFDVIYSCKIINSDDSKITDVIPNNILELIINTKIKTIYCNGKVAYNLLLKHNNLQNVTIICLPSTSGANASYNLDKLINSWQIIIKK